MEIQGIGVIRYGLLRPRRPVGWITNESATFVAVQGCLDGDDAKLIRTLAVRGRRRHVFGCGMDCPECKSRKQALMYLIEGKPLDGCIILA